MKTIYRTISLILLSCFLYSCIPISIAPQLDDGKVVRGKKFKRKLPNRYSYIFTDPKAADEFYYFINTKFDRQQQYVESNVPVDIAGTTYYLSFYETEKSSKTVNLLNPIVNKALENKGIDPILNEDNRTRVVGTTWYIVLMVSDESFNDALNPEYPDRKEVLTYTKALFSEYLSMSNYNQSILSKAKK